MTSYQKKLKHVVVVAATTTVDAAAMVVAVATVADAVDRNQMPTGRHCPRQHVPYITSRRSMKATSKTPRSRRTERRRHTRRFRHASTDAWSDATRRHSAWRWKIRTFE